MYFKIHFKQYIPSSLTTAEDWQEGVACKEAVGVAAAHCLPRSLRVPQANLPEIAAEDIVLKVMKPASNQLTVSLQHVEAMMLSQ